MCCVFEQPCGMGFKSAAMRGSLARKLCLNFRPDVNGDGHTLPLSQRSSFSFHPIGFVFLSQDYSPT
jgi:hypothetical protein